MLIKHVDNVDVNDEFIVLSGDERLLDVAKRFLSGEPCIMSNPERMCSRILSAYVIKDNKPVGVIHEDTILEAIVAGIDLNKITAKEVMKPPICVNMNTEVQEVVNLFLDKGIMSVAVCDGEIFKNVISVFDAIYLSEALDNKLT